MGERGVAYGYDGGEGFDYVLGVRRRSRGDFVTRLRAVR